MAGGAKGSGKKGADVLQQKSPAEFFADNKNIAGFDNVSISRLIVELCQTPELRIICYALHAWQRAAMSSPAFLSSIAQYSAVSMPHLPFLLFLASSAARQMSLYDHP